MSRQILKVLVGSRAHGLHNEDSDYDYRGVFIEPTSTFFEIGSKPKQTEWLEGEKEDDTNYEIGHFLQLATRSNPTILEVFRGPVITATPEGLALREQFPHVWGSKAVWGAFTGYSENQRKKVFADGYKDRGRWTKFAVAYLRVLIHGEELLRTGSFEMELLPREIEYLRKVKAGEFGLGRIVDRAATLGTGMWQAYQAYEPAYGTPKEPDLDRINEFLLGIRKANW